MSDKFTTPLARLLDATIILTGATAILYFANVTYLVAFYNSFGVPLNTLTFPIPDTFIACPLIGLFILAFMGGIAFSCKLYSYVFTSTEPNLKYHLSLFLLCLIVTLLWICKDEGQSDANSYWLAQNNNLVTFTYDKELVTGYHLLSRNGDNYLFYKGNNSHSSILILPAADVHKLELRPAIAETETPKPIPTALPSPQQSPHK